MIISDLNYLESATQNVAGASGFDVKFTKFVAVKDVFFAANVVLSATAIKGNAAQANATADAIGPNSFTSSLTQTTVVKGFGSSSVSESISAV